MKTNKIKPNFYISLWVTGSTKISPLALLVKTVVLISSNYLLDKEQPFKFKNGRTK